MSKRPLPEDRKQECLRLKAIFNSKKSELGLTQEKLAHLLEINQSSVSHYLNGVNPLNASVAAQFARILEVSIADFSERLYLEAQKIAQASGGAGSWEEHANVSPAAQEPSRRVREYPLISWVIAGEWAESADNYQPGDGEELIPGNAKAGDKGYWLEIKNDSMTPHFPEGTRILVQPEGFDLVIGKYYVALLYQPGGARETTFKQYTRDAGVEYLKPLNKEYRPIEITDQVRIIGRVVDFDPPKGLL